MKKKQRIIDALGVIKKDAPGLYGSIIDGNCPHEAGLEDTNAEKCGFGYPSEAFVMEYCTKCWRLAMEGKA